MRLPAHLHMDGILGLLENDTGGGFGGFSACIFVRSCMSRLGLRHRFLQDVTIYDRLKQPRVYFMFFLEISSQVSVCKLFWSLEYPC